MPCQGCEHLDACEVRIVMTRVRDALSDILDRMTLEEMVSYGCTRHPNLTYNILFQYFMIKSILTL